MKGRLSILLIHVLFQFSTSNSQNLDIEALRKNLEPFVNHTNNFEGISEGCVKDVQIWKKSLSIIGSQAMACNSGKTFPGETRASFSESKNSSTSQPQPCGISRKIALQENVYAMYQLDSFGKIPSNIMNLNKIWMGDYNECLDVKNPQDTSYKTHYCWAHWNVPVGKLLSADDTPMDVAKKETCGKNRVSDFKTSICMPRSCSEKDLEKLINQNPVAFQQVQQHSDSVCEVSCRPMEHEKDELFWLMSIILVTIITFCILATIIDFYGGKVAPSISAFSMRTNGQSLLRTSRNPNNLKGVECIRFLSFTWVVAGHVWGFWEQADNPKAVLNIFKTRQYEIWINAYLSVDTFFFLSGLMLSYSFLPKLTLRKAFSPLTWFIFYLHRILRLTPAYAFFILFYTTYGPLNDYGPNELIRTTDMANCRHYGWKNLLYINNLYEPRKNCLSVSWYLATDTQMYFVSPIFLIAFLFGSISGLLTSLLAVSISTALTYFLFYRFDLPGTLAQAYASGNPAIIHELQDFVYAAAYTRIPPFIFGICVGYILWKTRDRKINVNIGLNLFLWVVSTILALGAILAIHPYNSGVKWTIFQRATYYAFSRVAWSIALSWLIFAINWNKSGLIGEFMSLKFWSPLGKLSFCAYLCHILIVEVIFNLDHHPPHFVGATHAYISKVIPCVFVSMLFAVIWTLLFEMPFAKLEAIFLSNLLGQKKKDDKVKEKDPEFYKDECTKI